MTIGDGYAPLGLGGTLSAAFTVTTVTDRDGSSVVVRHPARRGSRRATVFLHGAAGSWTTWTPMLRKASVLGSPIAEPVLFDLPGWGEAVLARDSAATVETICELVTTALVQLGYTSWDLVGHSMGGFIALHLAGTRVQVESAALVSPTAYSVIAAVPHPFRAPRRIPAFDGLLVAMRILARVDTPVRALVRFLGRTGLLRVFAAPLLRHPFAVDGSVITALGRELRPRAFVAATEVTRDYRADAYWSRIGCPVSAMKGDRDAFVADYDLEQLAEVIPQIRRTIVTDCGHFGNIERPEETLRALGLLPPIMP